MHLNLKRFFKTKEVYQYSSQEAVFGVVTSLWTGYLRHHGFMLDKVKRFFPSKGSTTVLVFTQTPVQWITWALTEGVSRPSSESNLIHLVLSLIMSIPISPFLIRPSGMHMDNLIFTFTVTVSHEINSPFYPARDLSYSLGWQYCRPGR